MEAGYPLVTEPLKLERGDVAPAMAAAPHRLKGRMRVGGQDHFYLEGKIAFAIPGEDDEVTVYSSTQHPSEVQHMVAHVLGVPSNAVTIIVRRMGGGFGGKETQPQPVRGGRGGRGEEVAAGRSRSGPTATTTWSRPASATISSSTTRSASTTTGGSWRSTATFAARCGFSADLSRAGDRPGAVPRRQCLLLSGGAGWSRSR